MISFRHAAGRSWLSFEEWEERRSNENRVHNPLAPESTGRDSVALLKCSA
jgi:hypothetical protein